MFLTGLTIQFGEDKTRSILFSSKCKIKSARKLNSRYRDIKIKQHSQVADLDCVLNETWHCLNYQLKLTLQ